MKFSVTADIPSSVKVDGLVVFSPEFETLVGSNLETINAASGGAVQSVLDAEEFSGKEGQMVTLHCPDGYNAGRIILLGLGKQSDVVADTFRRVMGRAARYSGLYRCKRAAVDMGSHLSADNVQAAAEGCMLGSYKMLAYKTGESAKDDNAMSRLLFLAPNKRTLTKAEKAIGRAEIVAEGQMLARDLAATPSNDLTPKILADKAVKLGRRHGFSVKILDEKAIQKEKMGILWSVAKGSAEPPRFIICQYKGGPAKQKPIVLVGKGVMFDSGGISLKPGLNMHEMKQDMTGAAVVLSTIVTVARLGIKRNVVVLIPSVENMPSSFASKPGDIYTSRKGLTVEIINTDAEGRLILGDALDYANEYDPQAVLDVATLTGAAQYILGYSGAPIMGNKEQLLDNIREASDRTSERVWPLPIWDDHRDQMKSVIADLHNSGGRIAGTIAAGAFLEHFIGDWPWAHIDIAYMDMEPKGRPYIPKGATGWGVRLLTDLLAHWKKV